MTHQEFENYLVLLSRFLRLSGDQRDEISCELRDHLENRLAELTSGGKSKTEAVRVALEEFGDAASLAHEFKAIVNRQRRRWMMRFAALSVIGSFFLAVLAMSMWPQPTRFGSPASLSAQDKAENSTVDQAQPAGLPTRQDNNLATLSKLENAVMVDYHETRFGDVMDHLQSALGIQCFIHDSAIENAMDADQTITASLGQIRASTFLELVLERNQSAYTVRDGVVMIVSNDAAAEPKYQMIQVFDVSKIAADHQSMRSAAPRQGGFGGGLGGGGGGGGLPVDQSQVQRTSNQWKDALIDMITDVVTPNEWEVNGGSAHISVFNKKLIVRNHAVAIRQIGLLIDQLEGSKQILPTSNDDPFSQAKNKSATDEQDPFADK